MVVQSTVTPAAHRPPSAPSRSNIRDHTHPRRHHCRRQLACFVPDAGERDRICGDCASPDAHSNCSGLFIQHDAGIPAGERSGVAHFYVPSRTERASRQAGRVLRIRAEQCPRVLDLQHGLHHTRNDQSSIKTWLRTLSISFSTVLIGDPNELG